MKLFITALACLITSNISGQGWEQFYGGPEAESGESVQQTSDGGYIIAGMTNSFGNGSNDVYLIKTNENGVELWSQTYGGTGIDHGYSVQQISDGGYIIAGMTNSFGNGGYDVYLIKTSENGVEQWNQTYGSPYEDYGYSVQESSDGGYVIVGYTETLGNEEYDVYLIKTDGFGIEQWTQTYGEETWNFGNSVQLTLDGGFIICGFTGNIEPYEYYVYLIKTDWNGIEQWSQTYGTEFAHLGYSVQQTSDGGYILTGSSLSLSTNFDVYLIKTDDNGVEQWSQTYGGTNVDEGYSVQQTTDGGYIIAGYTGSFGNGLYDFYLVKTDGFGIEQWSQTYGATGIDQGYSVQQTTDGGYIIAGETRNKEGGEWNVYVIKTDSEGTLSSSFTIPTQSSNRNLDKIIDGLGREVNHTPNQILFYLYDDGSVEKKLIVE